MDANPSPGNKLGGLTTILEKSLGAMAKAGTTNLVEVLRYAEPVDRQARLRLHGHAGLRPGRRQRARWRAAPTCSASPPAAAASSAASRRLPSSWRPTRRCTSAWRTTWTSTAARILTGEESVAASGRAHLPAHAARRQRRADQERGLRFRRRGVRALGAGRDDVVRSSGGAAPRRAARRGSSIPARAALSRAAACRARGPSWRGPGCSAGSWGRCAAAARAPALPAREVAQERVVLGGHGGGAVHPQPRQRRAVLEGDEEQPDGGFARMLPSDLNIPLPS